jgi:hypothetical protein
MEKREQQADRERLDVLRLELSHGIAQRSFVELPQHVAAEIDALLHFPGQALRNERHRLVIHDVEYRRSVGTRLLAHGIDAAESFRHQQAGNGALAFEQRVGPDRGAVAEIADISPLRDAVAPRSSGDRARIVGRRGFWRSISAGRSLR